MAHANTALQLLLTDDEVEAHSLAAELDRLNRERREETTAALELAGELLTPEELAAPLLIVASRAVLLGHRRPCCRTAGRGASPPGDRAPDRGQFSSTDAGIPRRQGRASCRSIDAFDITALLRRHDDLFLRYGGHRAAAGFSIEASRLPELRARLVADAAERLTPADLTPTIDIEAELQVAAVNGELLRRLQQLGPHGIGNPTPRFLARAVRILSSRVVGSDRSHLQFTLKEGRVTWRAIAFGLAEHAVPDGEAADIVYTFSKDNFRGTLQLEVLDLRAAA